MAGVLFTLYSTCLCYCTTIEQKFFRKSCFTCVRVRNYRKSTAAFDARLEKETQDRISQIRGKMEEELQQELRQQKEDAKAVMARLEEAYEARHEEYAQALFKSMIKE